MSDNVQISSADGTLQSTLSRGDDGYYYVDFQDKMDEPFARKIVEAIEDARNRTGEKIALLVDVSTLREIGAPARRQLGDRLLAKGSPLEAYAVYGGNFYTRQLTNLYAKIARAVPLRGFSTKEEAAAWVAKQVQDA